MHDQSCHAPSAACQTPKSTGCCFGRPKSPKSGLPATWIHGPITGVRYSAAWLTKAKASDPVRTNAAVALTVKEEISFKMFGVSPAQNDTVLDQT